MTKMHKENSHEGNKNQKQPALNIRKIGIVSRDHNENKDFKNSLPKVLQLLDQKGCDAVLFSLWSLPPGYDPRGVFKNLKGIKSMFVEEFEKGNRQATEFVVYYRTPSDWKEYRLKQKFSTLTGKKKADIHQFVEEEMPKRVLGNCCVLLCGESNGVMYKRDDEKIHDVFKLRKAIPKAVSIILNPCHDYMRRFEMKLKREFLSKNNRWVISVWNKGKGRESKEPWTIYHNGKKQDIEVHDFDDDTVYVGILKVH